MEVVNALSTWLKLRTRRNGLEYAQEFRDGTAETPMAAVGDAGSRRGTEVRFLPSASIFTSVEFDKATVEHRLKELALLNPSVRIILTENRTQRLQIGADRAVGPRETGFEHP